MAKTTDRFMVSEAVVPEPAVAVHGFAAVAGFAGCAVMVAAPSLRELEYGWSRLSSKPLDREAVQRVAIFKENAVASRVDKPREVH